MYVTGKGGEGVLSTDLGEAEEETHAAQDPQSLGGMLQHFLATRLASVSSVTGLLDERTSKHQHFYNSSFSSRLHCVACNYCVTQI